MTLAGGGAAEADPGGWAARRAVKAMRSGAKKKVEGALGSAASWRSSPLKATARARDAAVDLGERDVHRDVAGAEAALALGPGGLGAAGEHDLQHGDPGGVERRGGPVWRRGADGEAGGVQDYVGRGLGEEGGEGGGGDVFPK